MATDLPIADNQFPDEEQEFLQLSHDNLAREEMNESLPIEIEEEEQEENPAEQQAEQQAEQPQDGVNYSSQDFRETISIEYPTGFKLHMASLKLDCFQLLDLAIQTKALSENDKQKKDPRYTG